MITLTIIGKGAYEDKLRRYIRARSATEFVTVITEASDEEIYSAYLDSDLFLLLTADGPRTFEGFGIAFLEAAAYGLPIVAGQSGGAREALAVGLNAVVASDSSSAADAIMTILSDPTLYTTMSSASIDFAERFDWAIVGEAITELYDRAASGG